MNSPIINHPVRHPLLAKYIKFFWELNIDHARFNHKIIPQRNIRSALNKKYRVKVAGDAHTTFSRSFITAETIIKHHNLVWQYLIPTRYKIEINTTEQIIHT